MNNPLFAFLADGAAPGQPRSPYRAYFEWARFIQPMLAQEEKLLEEKKQQEQQG